MPVAARSQLIGPHKAGSTMHVMVVLKLHDVEGLKTFLAALQNPASPQYHQFLTTQQFTAKYGPTQDEVATVKAWLKSRGLQATGVTPNRLAVDAEGTTAALEQAFAIQVNDYRYQDRTVYGPAKAPALPSAWAGKVLSVVGLSNSIRYHPMLSQASAAVSLVSYTPQQIATAYNWPSLGAILNGDGVIIANATLDSPNFSVNDVATFWNYHNLPSHSITVIPVYMGSDTGGSLETTLDEEWAGAMAPGATLQVFNGLTNSYLGLYKVYSRIITSNQAQIITTSWGAREVDVHGTASNPTSCPTPSDYGSNCLDADNQLFMEAAAQGQTIVAAAGDCGANDSARDAYGNCLDPTGGVHADFPSSSPYVVAAGGTTLTLDVFNAIASETAWSCGAQGGCTGGAVSQYFSEPAWQTGQGVPQNGWRNSSDLSLDADPVTGYDVYWNGSHLTNIGGTSVVAPQLAGLFAVFVSLSGHQRLGQANPVLYADANSSYYAADFHDITSGNNGFPAGTGWDHPTGWGSIDAVKLLSDMDGQIALSTPSTFLARYEYCVGHADYYHASWQAGQVGYPTSYELEEEISGTWTVMYNGSGTHANFSISSFAGLTSVRLRATNGTVSTPWLTRTFNPQPCFPPR